MRPHPVLLVNASWATEHACIKARGGAFLTASHKPCLVTPPRQRSNPHPNQLPSHLQHLAYMADAPAEAALCLICKTEAVTYMTLPCRHPSLCNKCAIKVATGGKCKVCNKFFQRLKKLGEPDDEEDEEVGPFVHHVAPQSMRPDRGTLEGSFPTHPRVPAFSILACWRAASLCVTHCRRNGVVTTTMTTTMMRMTSSSGAARSGAARSDAPRRPRAGALRQTLLAVPSAVAAAALLALGGMLVSRRKMRQAGGPTMEVARVALPRKLPVTPATAAAPAYSGLEGPLTVHTLQAAAWADGSAVEELLLGMHGGGGAVVGLDAEWPPPSRGPQPHPTAHSR